jgi:hypothetical protein
MNNSKFKINDRVLIIADSYKPHPNTTKLIGQSTKIVKVDFDSVAGGNVYFLDNSGCYFVERDLKSHDPDIKCRKIE